MEVKDLQPFWCKRVRVVCKSGSIITGLFNGYTPDEYDEDTDTEKPSIDITLDPTEYLPGYNTTWMYVEDIESIEEF